MSIATRRRWTPDELTRAEWLAARLRSESAGRAPSPPEPPELSGLQTRLLADLDSAGGRARLSASLDTEDLRALTLCARAEHGIVRDRKGDLILVRGLESRIAVDDHDTMLVHTHLFDLPPSRGDLQEAERTHRAPGLAVVGPDGRITDYDHRGLAPDTELSYVSDTGSIDGKLHSISTHPVVWSERVTEPPEAPILHVTPSRILFGILSHGLVLVRFAAKLGFGRLVPGSRRRKGELLRLLLVDLGPIFVKVGQALSMRPDLIGEALARDLAVLRREVPSIGLGRPKLRHGKASIDAPHIEGARIEEKPIARGSVADVHRGWLADGTPIAVKSLRKGVREAIDRDLWISRAVARIASALPGSGQLPILRIADEILPMIRNQSDPEREAAATRRFQESFSRTAAIRIPTILPELTDSHRIVMTWMPDLHPFDTVELSDRDRELAATRALRALYQMIFVDGWVHADLHGGNIFVHEGGDISLLDFGMVVRLSDSERRDFGRFFFAIATNNGAECARIAYENALFRPPDFDKDAFLRSMCLLVSEHSNRVARDFRVTDFVGRMFSLQRRMGLVSSTSFIGAIFALILFEGLARSLYPALDFQKEARTFLLEILHPEEGRRSRDDRSRFRAIQGPMRVRR